MIEFKAIGLKWKVTHQSDGYVVIEAYEDIHDASQMLIFLRIKLSDIKTGDDGCLWLGDMAINGNLGHVAELIRPIEEANPLPSAQASSRTLGQALQHFCKVKGMSEQDYQELLDIVASFKIDPKKDENKC